MDNKNITEATYQLDYSLGGVLVNLDSLKAIRTEMSRIREDVDNTDKNDLTAMGLRFHDMEHKLVMIDDLLNYAVEELERNYEECQTIKTDLHLTYANQGGGEEIEETNDR